MRGSCNNDSVDVVKNCLIFHLLLLKWHVVDMLIIVDALMFNCDCHFG